MLVKDGIAISDLSLLEFFSVSTDGRKMTSPLSAEEAFAVLEKILDAEEFYVCYESAGVMSKAFHCAAELNILRYGINDVYIAISLAEKGFNTILTRNTKDFKKFDFIKAINPFSQSEEPHAPSAMHSAPCSMRTIPYGRQSIEEKDVAAVCSVLRSDWLTTGPKVQEFEQTVADYVCAKYAVAVSSGTAALHAAMFALSIGPGDEVIVPPMTFAATANCILYQGGTPVFADVDPDTLLIDPKQVEAKITHKTKAIIGVDYAGQPCDWDALREIADRYSLALVDDGCHALGAEYKGKRVGSVADLTVFSFHPVKHITTGEGGMITTDNEAYAEKMRIFRNHGITTDHRQRELQGSWFYAMEFLGYNYRITDFQCALGISQLRKLPGWIARRQEIAARYDEALAKIPGIKPLGLRQEVLSSLQGRKSSACYNRPVEFTKAKSAAYSTGEPRSTHAYHLYVMRLDPEIERSRVFQELRNSGIGVNVHYIPVYLHPYYRKRLTTSSGLCPIAEEAYEEIVSLPIYPGLSDDDLERVLERLREIVELIDNPINRVNPV